MFRIIFLLVCISVGLEVSAQQLVNDSTHVEKVHSAKKATLLSTAIPGAGQIYNKKLWKTPIIWGGMGACVYFISNNRSAFRLYKNEIVMRESDADFVSTLTYANSPYANYLVDAPDDLFTNEDLDERLDKRKKWLDLSYFALVAVYGLNIIDANVDGHLFDYNISPDVSLRVEPSTVFYTEPKAGIKLTLNF